jgi:hypothetical protein
MNKLIIRGIAALSFVLSANSQHAQNATSDLSVGDRVRVSVPTLDFKRTIGTIDSINGNRMVLRLRRSSSYDRIAVHVPLEAIERVDLRDPRAGGRTAKASFFGATIAFVGVGVAGALMTSGDEYFPYIGALWAIPATVPGALIGGIVGHNSPKSWQRVATPIKVRSNALPSRMMRARDPDLSLSLAPIVREGGQFGLAGALRF